MEKAITVTGLAFSNIKRKPYRTAALIAIIALSAAVLFSSLVLVSSLRSGINGIQSRIGADLMIVPEGYESKAEGVLLSGEPSYFYMDKAVEDIVRGVEGVEAATGQFYLTSLSESCCDFPIQIIGFDLESDFIVKSWAGSKIKESGNGMLFAGSNITLEKNKVRFFGGEHEVTSKLSKSGTGMDNVIFADLSTLQSIFTDAKEKGFGFISDGDTLSKTSVILVRLKDGYSADGTSLRIKTAVGEKEKIQIIQAEQFVSTFAQKLSSLLIFIYAICLVVFIIAVLTLAVVFSLSLNERLKEFSVLRVLGANHSKLASLVFREAAVLGASGAAIGIFVAAIIVLPFNILISQKITLPFSLSSVWQIAAFALLSFVLSVLACLAASLKSALRISRLEPYGEVK